MCSGRDSLRPSDYAVLLVTTGFEADRGGFVLRVLVGSGEGIEKFQGLLTAFPKSDVIKYREKLFVSLTKDIGQFIAMCYDTLVYWRTNCE